MQELTEPQKKWIAALRSGKYKQGIGVLNRDGCHCAIGVACEIFKDELGLKYDVATGFGSAAVGVYDKHTTCAPDKLVDHLNLYSPFGSDQGDREGASVSALNDRGCTFEQIAKQLEKYPQLYFLPPCKS